MTVAKKETIQELAQRIVPHENAATVLDSLGTAWRRAAKGSEKSQPLPIGNFAKDRDDLTQTELRFVTLWLEKRANIEPSEATPSVSQAEIQAAIQKAVETDRLKRQAEFDARLKTEIEQALTADRKDKLRQHEAAKADAVAAERRRWQELIDAKVETEKERLTKQLSGNNAALLSTEKEKAVLMAKSEAAEVKANLVAEFEAKTEAKVQQALSRKETEYDKQSRKMEAAHQTAREAWEAEKQTILLDKETALEALNAEHQRQLANVEAELDETKHQLNMVQLEVERLAWKRKMPSFYDVVNITSNAVAAFGFVNIFGWTGVVLATMLISFFLGIVKDLKTIERKNAAWFGIIGASVIELVYGYIHNTFFQDLLKNKEHLGFDYHFVGTAFAIIISGASIYAALMTRLRTQDDAEAQRINDIDNSINNS